MCVRSKLLLSLLFLFGVFLVELEHRCDRLAYRCFLGVCSVFGFQLGYMGCGIGVLVLVSLCVLYFLYLEGPV